ncbi:DNA stabilization protein [Candidatus Hamiltonella defensa]|uniref:DNA stabilization protein n=1 Tax=Candidatus Williamhamiltonella defendens TaxID=138072 RepID=UPI0014516516|nr:DNA stabilization protein [Candidatus Hamiltonella defensa]CAB3623665.1 Putative tail needle protein [Bacteriophage APSE-7]
MNRRNADNPVEIQVTHIDPTILPANFSTAYRMIVLNSLSDMGRVAGKANEAADEASQSKTRNDEQDRELATQAQQINAVQADAISKSQVDLQSLSSSLNVKTAYSVNGIKVVGQRVTGFTAATGTALKGAFHADESFSIGVTYHQSEVQALANGLVAARQRINALEAALRSHGLID